MGRRFFNPETGIWRFFGWVGEIVVLSLLWTLCSIPLVTLGSASTALYDAAAHNMRRKESDLFRRFFGTFRREFKTACPTTLLWGAVAGLIVFLYIRLVGIGPDHQVVTAYSMVFVLLLFLLLLVLCWVFPLLSRFTFGFAELNRTAIRIALGNILRSVTMALIVALGIFACMRNYFCVFFVPGIAAWLSTFFIEPVFERYTQ
ncbi:MAG: DUF624 domain-containing protein [Oscillospiraceae bacterium]|nr:DUF624 domain-containing protein [Oscillospiraceae bacterium]